MAAAIAGTRIETGCFIADLWPQGFDYCAKAHKAGLKASLYMGGTYNDCDLTTAAGRDAELAAVLERYDQGLVHMWRSDFYTAPKEPMPQTYIGVWQLPVHSGPPDRRTGPASATRTVVMAGNTRGSPSASG